MKKNIAIVAGGYSSEYVISINSAKTIEEVLDKENYTPYKIHLTKEDWTYEKDGEKFQVNKNDFSVEIDNEKIQFDCAFIIIHGTPGEDGMLQGYFEMLDIPYTTCDVATSSLTFNKFFSKSYLRNFGVLTANAILLKKGNPVDENQIVKTTGLPCFIKPNQGGSSFGITKVNKKEQVKEAVLEALKEDDEVLIESFVKGIEVTCGLIKTKDKNIILPLTEIVSKNDFFDYEAKYTDGMADEISPARISETLTQKCQDLSSDIYDYLKCNGLVRMDYILVENEFYFLEVNTVPGMSANSIVPKMVKANEMTLTEFTSIMVDEALARKKK
jgi:D-alanine-D-alanine ligase